MELSVNDYAAELATTPHARSSSVGSATLVKYSRMAGEQQVAAHAFDDALPYFERAWRAHNAPVARRRVGRDSVRAGVRAGHDGASLEPAGGLGESAPSDRLLPAGG